MMDPEIVRRGLAEALRIVDGHVPDEKDLEGAPFLKDWLIEEYDGKINLIGHGTGHPTIPVGTIMTSAVLVMDEEAGWARTISRYYRLEPRLDMTAQAPATAMDPSP